MNKVILIGRITKDPELKYTASNIAVVQFTIAVNRRYTSNGERQADFISCVAWRNQAENLSKYIHKGGQICVEGQIQTRTYDDPNGQRRYITEVICDNIQFLETRSNNSGYTDVNQYDIPEFAPKERSYQQATTYNQDVLKEEKEESNPFEDLQSSEQFSDDDLPF